MQNEKEKQKVEDLKEVLIDTYRCLMQNSLKNQIQVFLVLIDTYRCLMQNNPW